MKRLSALTTSTAVVLLLLSSARASTPDSSDDGYVSHVDGKALRICYRQATPPVLGDELKLLWGAYSQPNKGGFRVTWIPGGTARVVSPASDGCIGAEIVEGRAKRGDHARPLEPAQPKH